MRIRSTFILVLILAMLLGMTGCSSASAPAATAAPEESAGDSSSAGEPTVITMTLPFGDVSAFEQAFEQVYPQYDLSLEYLASGVINGEVTRRLRNGHGADLVVTNLPKGEIQNYAYDITTEPFVELYQNQALKSLSIDGKLQYLPLPGSLYGIVVNETLTKELGLSVPQTTEELLSLFAAAKEQGVGVNTDGYCFGLGTIGSTYTGAYFVCSFAPDFLSTSEGVRWLSSFQDGKATFTGTWEPSVDFLKTCVDEGYTNPGKLLIYYNQALSSTATAFKPEVELPARTAIAAYTDIQYYNRICEASQDTFQMLPCLPSSPEGTPMISAVNNDYLCINKSIAEDPAKLQGALAVMEFLSSEQGQKLWMEGTDCPYSYLNGFAPDYSAIPASLQDAFSAGQVYVNPFPSDLLSVIGTNLTPVVSKGDDLAKALAAIDDYAVNGSDEAEYDMSVVGTVAEDMLVENANVRKEETKIGNLIADAVREVSGADVALVNGGGIRSSLYQGDVTGSDLNAVCPYSNLIIVSEMTGATLRDAITNGIQKTWKPAGQFLQVSGICYSYQPAADENDTAVLLSLTHTDGTEIKDDEVLTVAYTNYMGGSGTYVDAGDGYTMLNVYDADTPVTVKLVNETGKTFRDAMVSYFAAHSDAPVSSALEGRITIVEKP